MTTLVIIFPVIHKMTTYVCVMLMAGLHVKVYTMKIPVICLNTVLTHTAAIMREYCSRHGISIMGMY